MKKKYLYQGQIIDADRIGKVAAKLNMDVPTYIQKNGIKEYDEIYEYEGQQMPFERVYAASVNLNMDTDAYIEKYLKKKEEPTPSASLGGELPLQKENKGEGLVDAELQPQEPITLGNVFDDANKSFSLRNTIKEVPNNDLRNNAPITLNVPDEDAINKSKEIDKQYLENGIDPQKVATLTQGLNFTQEQKDNLDYIAKTNPAYFNRHLQHISWTAPFMKEMRKRREEAKLENDPQKAVQIEKAISDVYKNGQIVPYEQSREITRNALRGIRTIFDNPEEQQNKFAENAEYNYGQQLIPIKKDGVWYEPNAELNRGKDVAKMFDSGINDVQRIGLNYLEDLHPEQYQSYKGLLVPYKDGDEKNIDLQVGRQEKLMRLEALGLNIKYKAALEEFYKARERGDVESQNTYKEVLDNTQKFSENLIEKYPLVKQLDVEKLAMEVNGRDDLPTTRFMYVLGSAVDKTLKGGWEIISYPFRSEENYQKHLLEVVGDTKQAENITYLPQKYQTIQSFDIEQSKEAKAKFAEINSQDISDEEKNKQIADYISQNKNTVTREGIEGGRTNITMASMLYGVSDIAANLAPYVALTALTGGGASASALRAFSSEFSAASLTMFNDELSAAAERGEANPFASALRHTFINSAAMAGAGTASKIRELAIGSKNPAIKAMIANMDDKAIEAAIKKETQNRFKNIYEVAKNKMVQSATSAAKITPAIQLGGVVNDAMDGKEFDVNEQVKHLGVETFKFTLFGLLTGGIGAMVKKEKPNDIQKYSMLEAGKNSEYFIKNIDTQLQEGKINAEQYNVLKSNIEIAKKVFDNTPMVDVKGKPLSDKKKRDLTFVKFNELRAAELLKKDIPQELREKTEIELQAAKEEAEKIQSGKGGGVGGDVEARYNERKKSIEDKLNQQLEDNKDRLDDIEDKGGTKTVRQKIYQEHTNEMVELEKWKMKEDLKNEKNDTNLSADKTKKSNDNLLTDDEIFDKLDFGDDKVFVDKLLARGTPKSDILRTRFGKDALDKEPSLRMNAERNRISDKIEAETDPLKKLAMLINPEAWEQTHSSLLGGDFGTHNHHATNQAKVPLQIVKGEQPQKRFYDDYINGLRKGGNNDAADYLESIYNKQQENGWGNAIEGSVWTTPKGNTSNVGVVEGSGGVGGENSLSEGANKILGLHDNGVSFDLFDNNKLREIAKENGIDLPEGAKNSDIIEALKNKRNELANKKNETQDVNESIGTEDNTETILATAEKKGGIYSELAKAIKNALGNVKTIVTNAFKSDVSEHGDYGQNEIRINNNTNKNKLHIFFHEALHHVTREKIQEFEDNPNSKNLKPHEVEAILNLKRIFKNVTEKLNRDAGGFGTQKGKPSPTNMWLLDATGNKRGFANVHEFISEAFTNPEFQKILKDFKGEGKSPNLFKQFLDAVAKMLGLKDPTILDDIFHHTEKLIDEKTTSKGNTSNVGVEEGSGGVGGDLSKMNQSEFAQWIQDNKDYLHSIERESTSMAGKKITVKPFENQYYDLLTVRPEHREQFIKNKGVLSEVDFNEAKEYYKTLQKEEAKYSNSDSNPDWLQFNFGNTTNTEADGNRRKGYITISENSIDNFKGNISNLIAELNKALEGNYNGSFKIAQKLGTLKNQFDNLVIHGANAQEVQKALNIINKTLLENGVDNKISQIGIDGKNKKGDKTSHTRLLEEKIQNNELVKAVEQPTKETTKAETPISEEVKNEEITKLEEQRDAEIDEVLKPKLELEFIDNADIALNKQTGQDRVKVTKKGKSVTTKENFRDIQNDLKKMKSKLEALINCK